MAPDTAWTPTVADRRRRLASVRARTTLVASVVVAIALAVAGTVLLMLLRDRLVSAELSAAALRSRDIAALIDDTEEIPDDLSFPGEESGFSQVVSADGAVLASSENIDDEPALSALRPPVDHSDQEIRTGIAVGDERSRFAISARSTGTDRSTVTVITGSSLQTVDETWTAVLVFLLVGSPILVGIVALVTLKVVGRALAPVESIRRQVGEITEQGLEKRVPEPGSGDEIDRLAHSMNSMLERLQRSSERQRRFVADASHELRSPLASARATLEVTQAHHDDPAEILASIDDALIDHDRLEHLLADLLTLARLDDPSAITAMERLDVADLVVAHGSQNTDPRLQVRPAPSGASVLGNPRQLERVLTNLVDNALSNCRHSVTVAVELTDAEVVLLVDDDGSGIRPADRERVFERFVRLDEARTSGGGTGLGLAIVREIVLEHHGGITIEDSPLGGARFTVRLPRQGHDA